MTVKAINKTIYTLWVCDAWLMRKSYYLIGVFTSKEKAIATAITDKLYQDNDNVVIYLGELNNYENTEQKVFSTEFQKDRLQLIKK